MPKEYKLKRFAELRLQKERQDEMAKEQPDWAHLEQIEKLMQFFVSPGPGDLEGERQKGAGVERGPAGAEANGPTERGDDQLRGSAAGSP